MQEEIRTEPLFSVQVQPIDEALERVSEQFDEYDKKVAQTKKLDPG